MRKVPTTTEIPEGWVGPRWEYIYDGPEGGGILKTGPVSGSVKLSDGTVYSVTPEYIEFAPGHAGPINHHIERIHEEAGTLNVAPSPDVPDGYTFVHVCSERCGAEADNASATTV